MEKPKQLGQYQMQNGKPKIKKKQLPQREMIDQFIDFQIYIYTEGLITNHDWDFEKIAKKYIKSLKQHKKD